MLITEALPVIVRRTGREIDPSPVAENSWIDLSVAVGSTYYYKVSAVDAAGNEGYVLKQIKDTLDQHVGDSYESISRESFLEMAR